jgi:phage gp36-like protein
MPTQVLTETELRSRFGSDRIDQLADRDRDGQPDTGVVEGCILRAEGRCYSRLLGARYQADDLPTDPGAATEALKRVVGGLALWYLAEGLDLVSPQLDRICRDALAELDDLARGGASLVLTSTNTRDTARPEILTTRTTDDVVFTSTELDTW